MKILLINPPWVLDKESRDFYRITQPEGLGYIAAVLERTSHKVKLVDGAAEGWRKQNIYKNTIHFGMSYEEINSIIDSYRPDIVGISIISTLFKQNGFNLAKNIKEHNKEIKIVVGGAHPTVAKEDCLSNEYIDFVVRGEGELTMMELANELEKQYPKLEAIKGISYNGGNKVISTEPRELIIDLDSLPFPARHFYPMEDYFMASRKLLSSFALSTYNKKWATMISSRGCPYNCVFCSIHLSMGRRWRARSAMNVVSEIELLVKEYDIEHVAFLDDNMSLNKTRMNEIVDLILQKNIKFTWSTPNGLRADSLSEELLRKMQKAGCVRIAVAAESGSQRVVSEVIGKNLDLSHVVRVVKICKTIGMPVDCFFVMGLLGEKKEEIRQTLEFAKYLKKLGASGFNFAIATPFPGTRLHKQLVDGGYLHKDFNAFTMFRKNHFISTPDFTSDDLAEFQRMANKINMFPFAYAKFALLLLIRDPSRFLRVLKTQLLSFIGV